MSKPLRNLGRKRQTERRQPDHDFGVQWRQAGRKIVGQGADDREARLVDDQRGKGVPAIGQRSDRQHDLPAIGQGRRVGAFVTDGR